MFCSYNWYYVNIALGNFYWHIFLFVCPGSFLFFAFKPLKFSYSIKRKNNILHVCRHKKYDDKNYRRDGERKGKKDRGSFVKYRLNSFNNILQSGWVFCPVGLWGLFFVLCFKSYLLSRLWIILFLYKFIQISEN